MGTYELSYQFRGNEVKRDVIADSVEQALQMAGVSNPTLRAVEVERNPIRGYLNSGDGRKFIDLLRKFEHTMYVKVRRPEQFFNRYEKATGEKLARDTHGILISEQENKWGDELLITFYLGDFEPNFPSDAKPRLDRDSKTGHGVLNDNDYVWTLIEQHGFRFGKSPKG